MLGGREKAVRVGVLGGGQLGRMMATPAHRLGIDLIPLDPLGEASPAGLLCSHSVKGSFRDAEAINKLAEQVDILTVEIEHVDTQALRVLEESGKKVYPSSKTLDIIRDKLGQHLFFEEKGVPVVRCREVKAPEDIEKIAEEFGGFPIMLKSRFLAYDGRGNLAVKSKEEAKISWELMGGNTGEKLYVEEWANFQAEIAVMVARKAGGEVSCFPVVETRQNNNICELVVAPPSFPFPPAAREAALDVARKAVEALDGVGIFGVEMFWMKDGRILVNETAPRPHNSGHYTIEGCVVDQFEQHLRAITDLPLGDSSLKVGGAAMWNILGGSTLAETLENFSLALKEKGTSVHWYGKQENKLGRKMGHLTVVGDNVPNVLQLVQQISSSSSSPPPPPPLVGVIMGSDSDLPSMKDGADILKKFGVPFELTVVSAHRTPDRMYEYAKTAKSRGIKVIIAGAGGAAHLPGMVAALTTLPVIGVPVKSSALSGNDSLLSIVQMPRGVPVATVAIGNSTNAGLLAVRMLAPFDDNLGKKLEDYHEIQRTTVEEKAERLEKIGYEDYLAGMNK